jgi:sialidase-1
MKIVDSPKVICSNEDSIFGYFAWPTVCLLPGGCLAVVCSGFRLKHVCPFGKAVVSYSRDEGKSWTRPAPVIDTPLDDRDAGICAFGNRVILTSFNNTVDFQRRIFMNTVTEKGSSTETELIEAYLKNISTEAEKKYLGSTYKISEDGGYNFGGLKKSPVTSPHGPCFTPDKRLIWVGRRFSDNSGVTQIQCCVLDADDNFIIISEIPDVSDDFGGLSMHEPHAICLPDGTIVVAIRVQRNGEHRVFSTYVSRSDDGGISFNMPVRVLSVLGGSPPHLLLHSSGVIVMTYGHREKPYGIRAALSRDNGESWETDIVLTDDATNIDLGYPASVELGDGKILTVYYENTGRAVINQLVWEM